MNTKVRTQEQISALLDAEFSDSQWELTLATLRDPEARADWDVYHQIGDVLRSDDMALPLSANFSARMAARLEAEPALLVPTMLASAQQFSTQQAAPQPAIANAGSFSARLKRFAMPSVTAAAVATAVFVTAPQLLVAKHDAVPLTGSALIMVGAAPPTAVAGMPEVNTEANDLMLAQQPAEVLRDPRIDEYLMAHQQFSPSLYSSARYVRSATFANDSGK